jgi:hypothetical protein
MLSRQLVAAAELEDSGENIRSGYVSILFHLFLRDSSIGSTCVSVPTQWQYLILPSLLVSIPAPRTASDLSETHEELMGSLPSEASFFPPSVSAPLHLYILTKYTEQAVSTTPIHSSQLHSHPPVASR